MRTNSGEPVGSATPPKKPASEVRNFTGAAVLKIEHSSERDSVVGHIPALVCLAQSAGSLRFQFDMLPTQARELAFALLEHADYVDAGVA